MMYFLAALVGILFVQLVNAHSVIRENDLVISYTGITRTTCDVKEYRFQSFVTNVISDCVIECALREHCKVLNYLLNYKLCELYQINDPTNTTGKCYRVQKEDIRINKSPCSEVCGNGTACDRKTKTCQIKECLEVPRLANGRVLGNLRAVGNSIKYECGDGFVLQTSAGQFATCLQNGNWSTQAYCRTNCSGLPTSMKIYPIYTNGTLIQHEYKISCISSGYILLNSSNSVAKCLDNGTWDIQGAQCVRAPINGEQCFIQTSDCNHSTVRCVKKYDSHSYGKCLCAFGYKYDSNMRICKPDCIKYANESTSFQPTYSYEITGYDLSAQPHHTSNFEECVNHCNAYYPEYISIGFSNSNYCHCKSITKQQYMLYAGGTHHTSDGWTLYDRGCITRFTD